MLTGNVYGAHVRNALFEPAKDLQILATTVTDWLIVVVPQLIVGDQALAWRFVLSASGRLRIIGNS